MYNRRLPQQSRKNFHAKKATHPKVRQQTTADIFAKMQKTKAIPELQPLDSSFNLNGAGLFFTLSFLLNFVAAAYGAALPQQHADFNRVKNLAYLRAAHCPDSISETIAATAVTNPAMLMRFLFILTNSRTRIRCNIDANKAVIDTFGNIILGWKDGTKSALSVVFKAFENILRHTSNQCDTTLIEAVMPLYQMKFPEIAKYYATLNTGDSNIRHFNSLLIKYKQLLVDLELIKRNDSGDVSIHLSTLNKLVFKNRHARQINAALTDTELKQLQNYFEAAKDCLCTSVTFKVNKNDYNSNEILYTRKSGTYIMVKGSINYKHDPDNLEVTASYLHAYDAVANLADDVADAMQEYADTIVNTQLPNRDGLTLGGLTQKAIETFYPETAALLKADEARCDYRSRREL